MSKHKKYFDILHRVAETVEPVARQRLAACLVYKNQIVSMGINKRKTHPFQQQFAKHEEAIFLHAETDCIVNALRQIDADDLKRCSMYITRIKKSDENAKNFISGLAKPCDGCQRALAQFDIGNVYYSLDNEGWEKL
jgi:tRNA(Arg) A34 adenosine deaminase TadA